MTVARSDKLNNPLDLFESLTQFSEPLTKLAYQTFQQGKLYFSQAHKTLGFQVQNLLHPSAESPTKPVDLKVLQKLQQRVNGLLEIDWQDAEQGVYPASLLFENDWQDFFRYYPAIWLDMLQTWERINQNKKQDFSSEVETIGYPKYYLQNFHWQTDGYLSDFSANLYDLQVELLFSGTTDAMRRRILAPLKQGLKAFEAIAPQQIKILDVACGTGRTLKLIRSALPKASLFGTDLSPAYLRKANQILSQNPGELPQLLQANVENLPYLDNYFHATTSVFLFHELPAGVRSGAIAECFRVTQPGGIFIIADSIQLSDSPEFAPVMENFSAMFHEPYYMNYVADNLTERLEKVGFTDITTEVHFLTKYWIARKPVDS